MNAEIVDHVGQNIKLKSASIAYLITYLYFGNLEKNINQNVLN
jgi:hypothetical protein